MIKIDVCIILVNYNSIAETRECLLSIKNSIEYSSLPFVVIVDNASVEKINLEEDISFYPFYELIRTENNIGFGKANNLGISWAVKNLESNFIFLLNNDTIIFPNTIEFLKIGLKNSPNDFGVATPRILFHHNPKLAWYDGGYLSEWRFGPVVENFNKPFEITKATQEVTFISGCAMFFKTDILIKIHGFHPIFFMYEEDVELCFRLIKNHIRMLFVPDALILHKEFGSQKKENANWLSAFDVRNKNSLRNFYTFNKNRLIVFRLHGKILKDFKFFLYFPTYLMKHSINYLFHGNTKIFKTLYNIFADSSSEYKKYKNDELVKNT